MQAQYMQIKIRIGFKVITKYKLSQLRNFAVLNSIYLYSQCYIHKKTQNMFWLTDNPNKAFIDIRLRPGLATPLGVLYVTTPSPRMAITAHYGQTWRHP